MFLVFFCGLVCDSLICGLLGCFGNGWFRFAMIGFCFILVLFCASGYLICCWLNLYLYFDLFVCFLGFSFTVHRVWDVPLRYLVFCGLWVFGRTLGSGACDLLYCFANGLVIYVWADCFSK